MDRGGGSGGEHVEPGESVGNASRAVFHVDDDEVVAGETGDLGEGRGEAEEEETVWSRHCGGFEGVGTSSFLFFVLFFFFFCLFSVWPQYLHVKVIFKYATFSFLFIFQLDNNPNLFIYNQLLVTNLLYIKCGNSYKIF
jgi:hypothetical protein